MTKDYRELLNRYPIRSFLGNIILDNCSIPFRKEILLSLLGGKLFTEISQLSAGIDLLRADGNLLTKPARRFGGTLLLISALTGGIDSFLEFIEADFDVQLKNCCFCAGEVLKV